MEDNMENEIDRIATKSTQRRDKQVAILFKILDILHQLTFRPYYTSCSISFFVVF